jgi:hypothetical protein
MRTSAAQAQLARPAQPSAISLTDAEWRIAQPTRPGVLWQAKSLASARSAELRALRAADGLRPAASAARLPALVDDPALVLARCSLRRVRAFGSCSDRDRPRARRARCLTDGAAMDAQPRTRAESAWLGGVTTVLPSGLSGASAMPWWTPMDGGCWCGSGRRLAR